MLQSCAVYGSCASKGSGSKEAVLTSCSTKATLAGVMSIAEYVGSRQPLPCGRGQTDRRSLDQLVLWSCTFRLHRHAHELPCTGSVKHTLQQTLRCQEAAAPDMTTRCSKPQVCCNQSARRTLLFTCK